MTEQLLPAIGTVAEEAARLIEAMATLARSSQSSSPYAGGPAQERVSPVAADAARPEDDPEGAGAPSADAPADAPPADAPSAGAPSSGACNACGAERGGTPVACRLCPLCQGIALLRSVRPETVDRLADLASAVADSLRDVATQSRSSGPASAARPASGRPSDGGRATVQDIHVADGYEG